MLLIFGKRAETLQGVSLFLTILTMASLFSFSSEARMAAAFGPDTKLASKSSRFIGCPRSMAPVISMQSVTPYAAGSHSVVDPARAAQAVAATAPLNGYAAAVGAQSDAYLMSGGTDLGAANCALGLLDDWASKNALTGDFNMQGGYQRRWAMVPIVMSYLAIRDARGLDSAKKNRIANWIHRVSVLVVAPYRTMRTNSNHLYWTGLEAIVAGIATDDHTLFNWGVGAAKVGLDSVQSNGALPSEMERGSRALHYHLFSLTALALAAEFANSNGVNLFVENSGALKRLGDLVIRNLGNSSEIDQLAGAKQDAQNPKAVDLGWAEIYARHYHEARLRPYLQKFRPIRVLYAGGNTTLKFAPGTPILNQ